MVNGLITINGFVFFNYGLFCSKESPSPRAILFFQSLDIANMITMELAYEPIFHDYNTNIVQYLFHFRKHVFIAINLPEILMVRGHT